MSDKVITQELPTPYAARPERYVGLVQGYWYEAVVFGYDVHRFWVCRQLTRAEAREVALEFVGGPDRSIYDDSDIDSVRKVRGPDVV